MKIVHFSDPHAGGPAEDWLAYLDKRWVGVFNYRFRRRFRHDLSLLARAVEETLKIKPDAAVCTGDLTSSGQPGEFARTLEILEPLRSSGIPLFYTPGNHDCYVKRPWCVRAVEEAVARLNRPPCAFAEMPLVRTVGGIDFILLNTSRPSNLLCSWGFVSRRDSAWVMRLCGEEKQRPRILLSHYPMLEDHPILRLRHRLFGQKKIVAAMRDGAIDLVLCGHVHRPYARVDASGRGEICAGSVTRNGVMSVIEYREAENRFVLEQVNLKEQEREKQC